MTDRNRRFLDAYLSVFPNKTVYTEDFPNEMKASQRDSEGWIAWKPIKGTLQENDYTEVEKVFDILFPKSFINWHKAYFFLDGDCSIIKLPASNPMRPLEDIKKTLDWYIPQQLIPQKLYPFAYEGSDIGPLVFDGRQPMSENDFPVRVYDQEFGGDIEGLSDIIFSSFGKLLECVTYYLTEKRKRKDFEIIPEFFQIDPSGAGNGGVDYWLNWASMLKANFKEFGR
jgi:hypothetical protein